MCEPAYIQAGHGTQLSNLGHQVRWKNVNILCQKCIWCPEPNLFGHRERDL